MGPCEMAAQLEVIDGGRSSSSTFGITFAGAIDPATIGAIQRLLRGAIDGDAAGLRLDPAPSPIDVAAAQSPNSFCFSLRSFEGLCVPRRAHAAAPRRQSRVATTVVISMKGIVASVSPSINMRIVALPDPEIAAPTEFLRLLRSEGRDRPALIRPDPNKRLEDLPPARKIDSVGTAAIEAIELADAAALLARNAFPYDVALASPRDAEVLASIAHELAGDKWIATRVDYCEEEISSRMFAVPDCKSDCSIGAEAIISAAAEIIAVGGFPKAAAKIRNALFSALEDNLHTSIAPLIAPYTRRLSDTDFIDCVTERLGKEPARLPVTKCRDEPFEDARTRATSGRLELVHSA